MALPTGRGRDEVPEVAGETGRADMKEAERADQIRLYSGAKFTPLKEAEPGMVVAVTGPEHTRAGQGQIS